MSDLAGFLLARIAEDEAMATPAWPTHVGNDPLWGKALEVVPDEFGNSRTEFHLAISTARVLAECEAKRRIVEEAFIVQAGSTEVVYIAPNGRQGRRRALYPSALEMLKALAAVYADHPEFDARWRFASPGDDDGRWDDDGGRQ